MFEFILIKNSNRNSIMREAVNKIARSINRIDYPKVLATFSTNFARFLTQYTMGWIGLFDGGNDVSLNPLIDFSNKIIGLLFDNANFIHSLGSANNEFAGRKCRVDSYIYNRIAHNGLKELGSL